MGKTAKALLAVQTSLKVPKAQRNEFGGFNYRSAEDILAALKPLLAEHQLLLTLNDDLVQKDTRFYIKATVSVCHVDETEAIRITAYAREPEEKKKQDDAMVTGGSSSYARKYALGGMFLCDDTPDPDATHEFKEEKKQPAPKPPKIEEPLNEGAMQRNYTSWVNAVNAQKTMKALDGLVADNKDAIVNALGGEESPILADFRNDVIRKKESLVKS